MPQLLLTGWPSEVSANVRFIALRESAQGRVLPPDLRKAAVQELEASQRQVLRVQRTRSVEGPLSPLAELLTPIHETRMTGIAAKRTAEQLEKSALARRGQPANRVTY